MNRDQELLSAAALTAFKLNGQFLELAEGLAKPVGLTAAWWQVLGAVLQAPLPVAGIAREMGITRQAVQRTADVLVERGLAEYRDNPAHRRAKLVAVTDEGLAAVRAINPEHAEAAQRLSDLLGQEQLARAVDALTTLSKALDALDRTSSRRAP
ncbi:transcriptional regulator, MarR family [Kribbella flavida DSM 17836]|uniref:Transcriptional regulator, MarR family n=1 Tax=Kribbella flavida (strain DSM 17836 / JCM 10339 / NBRC 14399) TaxID=479435 RepID=D2Q0H2_KRIFD|nr:helix-turn-helix domain-containing protein [Kribbella flavida]ADB31964.1 transcriptional regulator, MarR family [Kribbella flavida DSM 17836]